MVICLAWYSRGKRRFKRRIRKNKRIVKQAWKKSGTGRLYNNKYNRRHKIVGLTPDYFVSPIDAVPYMGPANKAYRGVKYTRKTGKRVASGVKAGYRATKSRGRRRSSPNRRKKPRGKFYYYRGKRYYRK